MKTVKSRSVYRYFDPTDAFVQILLCDAEQLKLKVEPGMNRKDYRRLVIKTCMPEFDGPIEEHLSELLPDDPLLGEDLLYQLCVEVNPSLNIHTVRLFDEKTQTMAEPEEPRTDRDDYDSFLVRLRKISSRLEKRLLGRVIGQNDAVSSVAQAVQRAAAGLAPEDRPLSSLLLVGRTGTGKTELARSLADELFGRTGLTGRSLVRVDCSEFAHAHEYSKLIGAPPGYVGHQEGGFLTEALLKNRECVVLFDEIEKAHPKLHNLLLQILEEGALTDGRGRVVSFDRAVVILTSNAGAGEIQSASRSVGFLHEESLGDESLRDITMQALEEQFSPEFLGRLDEIQFFSELDIHAARQIAQVKLTDLARRARSRGLSVAFTPAVAQWVAQRGFSATWGAREIRRVVQREIEPQLAELLIDTRARGGALLRTRIQRDELVFEFE